MLLRDAVKKNAANNKKKINKEIWLWILKLFLTMLLKVNKYVLTLLIVLLAIGGSLKICL